MNISLTLQANIFLKIETEILSYFILFNSRLDFKSCDSIFIFFRVVIFSNQLIRDCVR